MMALPADFRASIPRCVRSPAGGISPAPPPKKALRDRQEGWYKQGRARRRMRQTGRRAKKFFKKEKGLPGSWSSPPVRLLFGDWEPANGRHVRVRCQSCGRVLTTLVIRQCGSAICKSDQKQPPGLIKLYLMSLSSHGRVWGLLIFSWCFVSGFIVPRKKGGVPWTCLLFWGVLVGSV